MRLSERLRRRADGGGNTMASVNQADIIACLESLGVRPCDRLIVHSSLSSMGHVEGGAGAVCAALMAHLTTAGTLMMPSFNHGAAHRDGGCFSTSRSGTTNGAIPDAFWRLPGVYRSLHPTHSVACWGSGARELISGHHLTTTMGADSPIGRLERLGGKAVLINVPGANTFHHVVEVTNRAPCLGLRTEAYRAVLPDGREVELRAWSWRTEACPIADQGQLYYGVMRERGVLFEEKLGAATVYAFRLADCRRALEPLLSGASGGRGCATCSIRPSVGPRTVTSDWDAGGQCLRPDTRAYTGPWPIA